MQAIRGSDSEIDDLIKAAMEFSEKLEILTWKQILKNIIDDALSLRNVIRKNDKNSGILPKGVFQDFGFTDFIFPP